MADGQRLSEFEKCAKGPHVLGLVLHLLSDPSPRLFSLGYFQPGYKFLDDSRQGPASSS